MSDITASESTLATRYFVVADIHLYKNLFFLVKNEFSDYGKHGDVVDIWNARLREYIFDSFRIAVRKYEEKRHFETEVLELRVVFLGDVFDSAYVSEEEVDLFEYIVRTMLSYNRDNFIVSIYVLVGNHDTSSRRNLLEYSCLRHIDKTYSGISCVKIIPEIYYETFGYDDKIIFLYVPYYKYDELPGLLAQYRAVTSGKFVYIFSHNNIYTVARFKNSPMYKIEDIKQVLDAEGVHIFNGHIHITHYEHAGTVVPDCAFFQLGSVGSTSFKEDNVASGICWYDVSSGDYEIFNNRHLVCLSINNAGYTYELLKILNDARKHKAIIFLKFPELFEGMDDILEEYSDVILAVQKVVEFQKHQEAKRQRKAHDLSALDDLVDLKSLSKRFGK